MENYGALHISVVDKGVRPKKFLFRIFFNTIFVDSITLEL